MKIFYAFLNNVPENAEVVVNYKYTKGGSSEFCHQSGLALILKNK